MSRGLRADYQQQFLLPPSLEEWVGPNHPARFIREFVAALDVDAAGFETGEADTGRPPYAVDLLLAVWLYGYMNKLRSSRVLERACGEHMGLIWLCGRLTPDHNTLWRFWRANRAALRRVFRQVVQVAVKADLVGLVLHAIDGTKIAAQASPREVWSRAQLERLLGQLDEVVDEIMAEVEAAEAAAGPSYRLPSGWEDAVARREQLRRLLSTLEVEQRAYGHAGEPEARLMKTTGGAVVPAYNAQLAVDQQSGLIVGQEVVTEESDSYELAEMVAAVEATVGTHAAETVADGGYHTPGALAAAAARHYPVLVNESVQRAPRADDPAHEFHSARFTYDPARDCCVCPRAQVLRFERARGPREHRGAVRVYHCTQYRQCPVRWQCSQDPRGRRIEIGEHHAAVVAQRLKRGDPVKRQLLRQRNAIVEGPIGIIKAILDFRRWTVAGLENVRTQWALVCTGFNLRKLYRVWRGGRLALAA
jgi:transposase